MGAELRPGWFHDGRPLPGRAGRWPGRAAQHPLTEAEPRDDLRRRPGRPPHLFGVSDPAKLLTGTHGLDLPRNGQGIALIGDPRHDVHIFAAHLHLALLPPGSSTFCGAVAEEAGVIVGRVTYQASQAWPFPAGLMVGFTAEALASTIRADNSEVLEARWFTAPELRARIADPSLGGPYRVDSIGKFLIEDWLASQA